MRQIIAITVALLLTAIVVSAYSGISVHPHSQDVKVGDTGKYTLVLETDYIEDLNLTWDVVDRYGHPASKVLAKIGDEDYAQSGKLSFTSTGGEQTFDLFVQPQAGVTLGEYNVIVALSNGQTTTARASVSAGVNVTPELSTVALTSAGLIVLFGLVRHRRKD